jgi:hypothetical protein
MNVIDKSESVKDVTLQYTDTESRLRSLRIEQETLEDLLLKAEKLEDVFAIQSRLTEIRYEIENYETALRNYDQSIAYSMVTINLDEVEKETEAGEKGFGAEIKRRLSDNLYYLGRALRSLSIWLISSLPYFVIIAIIIAAILIPIKIREKRRKNKIQKASKENEK